MKHFITLLLALLMLACCVPAGAIANPVVEVYDDDAFEDTLNIEIDDDELYVKKPVMSIIADEIGQIVFDTENPEGGLVKWTLRFTRKEELDGDTELFAGVYADDFVGFDPFEYTWTEPDDKDHDDTVTVTVRQLSSESANTDLYFWSHRGVFYELTVEGDYSNMQFAEVFDSVMAACFD